jgi:hypothetical protein
LGSLQPVRQPITAPEIEPEIELMSEEEFDSEPEPTIEEKPSLTQTILSAIAEEVEPIEKAQPTSQKAPDFSEISTPSRGPPGGGRLVREGAPAKPTSGPPTRGPPRVEAEPPSSEAEELPTLTPVLRPVLKPTSRKVLTPLSTDDSEKSDEGKPVILKPISRAVLKPIGESPSDEEE